VCWKIVAVGIERSLILYKVYQFKFAVGCFYWQKFFTSLESICGKKKLHPNKKLRVFWHWISVNSVDLLLLNVCQLLTEWFEHLCREYSSCSLLCMTWFWLCCCCFVNIARVQVKKYQPFIYWSLVICQLFGLECLANLCIYCLSYVLCLCVFWSYSNCQEAVFGRYWVCVCLVALDFCPRNCLLRL